MTDFHEQYFPALEALSQTQNRTDILPYCEPC